MYLPHIPTLSPLGLFAMHHLFKELGGTYVLRVSWGFILGHHKLSTLLSTLGESLRHIC